MDINPADLRISTYPERPTGGMHTNGPNPGIRIVHIPTGTEATCTTERSQHQNRVKAMAILVKILAKLPTEPVDLVTTDQLAHALLVISPHLETQDDNDYMEYLVENILRNYAASMSIAQVKLLLQQN